MIFLLGGHGFVGSGFARVLTQRGEPFEIVTRANYADFVGRDCNLFINANGNSSKVLARNDPKFDFAASVGSVRDTLIDFQFDHYLYLSSGDVYPDCSSLELTREEATIDCRQQSVYGFHKSLAEQCVQYGAQRWTIVRQGGFVGPGLRKNAVFDVLHGDRIWVHPDSRFQFIHTDASAAACLELAREGAPNEVYNLTASGTVSVQEVMELAGRMKSAPDDAAQAVYEMSTAKASAMISLPSSRDCVRRFLDEEGIPVSGRGRPETVGQLRADERGRDG